MFLQGSKNYFYALSGEVFIKKSEVYFVPKTSVCHVLETAPRAVLLRKLSVMSKICCCKTPLGHLPHFFIVYVIQKINLS